MSTLAIGALASSLLGVGAAAAPPRSLRPRVVTSFPWTDPHGRVVAGLALGPDKHLYASVTTRGDEGSSGQIVRISPRTGEQRAFGPTIATAGLLSGVAFDGRGRLYVADTGSSRSHPPGVYHVGRSRARRVLTLPAESFPRALALHDGRLYVSDSRLGAIWRTQPDRPGPAAGPWLQQPLLLPGAAAGRTGASGIAFRDDELYVAVADAARIIRIALLPDGSAGEPLVVAEQDELRGADGITFDPLGNLWIVTDGPTTGRLEVLTPFRALFVLADRPTWLDFPTMAVHGGGRGELDPLYIANGSLADGTPNVIAIGGAPRLP